MKKIIHTILIFVLLMSLSVPAAAAETYTDVPSDSWASESIRLAATYNLMEGVGDGEFGYGDSISRAEFVTVLVRMFGWDNAQSNADAYTDTVNHWAAGNISTASAHDVIDTGGAFRPNDSITREEMSVMLVRALGYRQIAINAANYTLPFDDVTGSRGYIAVAYDIGMTNGVSDTSFAPKSTATREQAAAMLVRIYEKYYAETDWVHGFYAFSSYSQIDLTKQMDAVSLGWSRMTYTQESGAILNTTTKDQNEYYIPSGYESAVQQMKANNTRIHLSVYMDNNDKVLSQMLENETACAQAVQAIIEETTRTYSALGYSPYSGVTIDFEGLYGAAARENFNSFLTLLSAQLQSRNMTLYVAVMPATADGAYYDGYDYRTIGSLADKVILMAHDYQAKSMDGFLGTEYYKTAALTPIQSVYYSLRSVTDPNTGVEDRSKIVLAINCTANAWETDENGKLISSSPTVPTMQTVYNRLSGDVVMGYSDEYRNPWITYETESGQHIFLWYENGQSIGDKVQLAKLFGINSVSFWRLGLIPDYQDAADYDVLATIGR